MLDILTVSCYYKAAHVHPAQLSDAWMQVNMGSGYTMSISQTRPLSLALTFFGAMQIQDGQEL